MARMSVLSAPDRGAGGTPGRSDAATSPLRAGYRRAVPRDWVATADDGAPREPGGRGDGAPREPGGPADDGAPREPDGRGDGAPREPGGPGDGGRGDGGPRGAASAKPADPDPLSALTLAELRCRTSVKWRVYPEDVLPLWVAEMDAAPAEPVVRAVGAAMARGDTGYPAGTAYQEAFAAFAATRWGWRPNPDRMRLVTDVMLGIVEALGVLTRPGDAVVINPPVYPPFEGFPRYAGRTILPVPLGPDLRLDLPALEEAFAGERSGVVPAAYLLCNPHNPTGTTHTAAELAAVARLAREHGVRVIVDEIHGPIELPGAPFVPYLSVPGAEDGVVLTSASKAWSLAGIKAALLVAGDGAAPDLARVPEEASGGVSHLGVIAHVAALRDGVAWLDAVLAGIARNRDLLGRLVAEHLPGVVYHPPQGTYLAWLDCRALDLDVEPARAFLTRGRVAVNPGPSFGPGGEGFVRLNLATSPAIITEAVRRMATVLPGAAGG